MLPPPFKRIPSSSHPTTHPNYHHAPNSYSTGQRNQPNKAFDVEILTVELSEDRSTVDPKFQAENGETEEDYEFNPKQKKNRSETKQNEFSEIRKFPKTEISSFEGTRQNLSEISETSKILSLSGRSSSPPALLETSREKRQMHGFMLSRTDPVDSLI